MRILLFIFLSVQLQAQTITIAYMGDSHCNGGFGLGDSNWISRTTAYFTSRGYAVNSYKFCSGGETIKTNMPLWYPGSVSGKSIDNALAVNPDLILILQSGNHVAFGIPQDTSKWCYQKIADTLRLLGKRFLFSDIGPRQNTYSGGADFTSYNAQADSLNRWLYATYPGRVFSLDTLRNKSTKKPYAYLLLSDSLHYWYEGHRRMWQTTISAGNAIDSIAGYTNIKAVNARFSDTGVTFDGIDAKYMEVYGSNDGVTFSLIDYKQFSKTNTISAGGYAWMKLVIYNNRKRITITKKL